jgi:lipopolysaccharide transport system ATP-binding protein
MRKKSIVVKNISKQYRLGHVGTGTLKNDFYRFWHTIRGKEDPFLYVGTHNDRSKKNDTDWVWALEDIDFSVEKGEVLGIVGRNGAGKSTLLKILSKITAPTKGEIEVHGRIASLLEVGTGFHPDLSGRENIYLNGAILGMRKNEIKSKLDSIIDFSGVEGYIDTPVKRYSSGMKMRLGFAVAAFLEPDILIVDEVLAVGDAEFQKKCLGKIKNVSSDEGRTVLFVSHNLGAVKNLTTRCIMLEHGKMVSEGEPGKVIEDYLKMTTLPENIFLNQKRINEFWGRDIILNSISALFPIGVSYFHFSEELIFEIGFCIKNALSESLRVGCTISTLDDKPILSLITGQIIDASVAGQKSYKLCIKNLQLFPGTYKLSLSIGLGSFQESRKEYDVVRDALVFNIENLSDSSNAVYNWIPGYGNILHRDASLDII